MISKLIYKIAYAIAYRVSSPVVKELLDKLKSGEMTPVLMGGYRGSILLKPDLLSTAGQPAYNFKIDRWGYVQMSTAMSSTAFPEYVAGVYLTGAKFLYEACRKRIEDIEEAKKLEKNQQEIAMMEKVLKESKQ